MKFLKTLFILVILSACQTNLTEEGFAEIGIEPYRMASDSIESSSLSPGEYIIKSAYGSMDVSTSNFEKKVDEFKNLVTQYNGNISDSYLSTNYQGLKSFSITSNIPAADFDQFILDVENIKDFSDISINANAVSYTHLRAHETLR